MHRTAAVVLLSWSLAFAAACGGKSKGAAPPPSNESPTSEVVTLKGLHNGDRACYVEVESAIGEQSIEGTFELCEGGSEDASALIGKRIRYKTRPAEVQAASCEGDPECRETDPVDLVIEITPAE
jgi:hypothetical protein